MSGFLYYIPGKPTVTTSDLDALGINHGSPETIQATAGPDKSGRGGVVFVFPQVGGSMPRLGFYAGQQTWRECKGFWIGFETANPPQPADLERGNMLDGYVATMQTAFGKQAWQCPTAKVFPTYYGLDKDGNGGEIIEPEYEELSKSAELVFNEAIALRDGEVPEEAVREDEQRRIAVQALAVNYRVTLWELTVLRLLKGDNLARVLMALIDGPNLPPAAERKKKE